MKTVEEIKEYIREQLGDDAETVVFENEDYATAFIGLSHDDRAIYDYNLMIEHLLEKYDDWDYSMAVEWIDFNTIRAIPYMGENKPIILYRIDG